MKHNLPYLVVSDGDGNLFELPPYLMTGMTLSKPVLPENSQLIELPYGSNLYMLPGRIAIGYDPDTSQFVEISEYRGNPVYAASAFMAPAYMQLLRSAYRSLPEASVLPLYSYTALGWMKGKFYVSGIRIDKDQRQDLIHFDFNHISKQAHLMKKKFHKNRLVSHLVDNCVFKNGCPAARNFVLKRWECPLPTSPACNSRCAGCLSFQKNSSVCASQDRISFVPDVRDVVEIGVYHLTNAPRPVISFGQGCEGEPLLVGDLLEEAIKQIRRKTDEGIINLNTNGSKPDVVKRLCKAGLDSIRVSLNSAQAVFYDRYYQPQNYSFSDVMNTLAIVREYGRWSSINYFIFSGFTDNRREMKALYSMIKNVKINMIQTRNLNIDPEWYIRKMEFSVPAEEQTGLAGWLSVIHKQFPWIKTGYFNPPREEMKKIHYQFT